MLHAVPGYVLAPDMRSAKLFVTPPTGVTLKRVDVSDAAVMIATLALDGRGVAVDANASTPSPVVRHTISWAYFVSFSSGAGIHPGASAGGWRCAGMHRLGSFSPARRG